MKTSLGSVFLGLVTYFCVVRKGVSQNYDFSWEKNVDSERIGILKKCLIGCGEAIRILIGLDPLLSWHHCEVCPRLEVDCLL